MAREYAYASTVDVAREISVATFTASSRPNATQVHNHLLAVSDELDSRLSALNYSTPVPTGATQAGGLLSAWAAIGGAMYAAAALPQGADGKHLPFLERRWGAILTQLDEGQVTLPGLGKDTVTSRVRYGTPGGAYGASPIFVRDPLDI